MGLPRRVAASVAYGNLDGLDRGCCPSKLSLDNPLLNPTLVSVSAIVLVLLIAKVDYRRYFEGPQFIHFLPSRRLG